LPVNQLKSGVDDLQVIAKELMQSDFTHYLPNAGVGQIQAGSSRPAKTRGGFRSAV